MCTHTITLEFHRYLSYRGITKTTTGLCIATDFFLRNEMIIFCRIVNFELFEWWSCWCCLFRNRADNFHVDKLNEYIYVGLTLELFFTLLFFSRAYYIIFNSNLFYFISIYCIVYIVQHATCV